MGGWHEVQVSRAHAEHAVPGPGLRVEHGDWPAIEVLLGDEPQAAVEEEKTGLPGHGHREGSDRVLDVDQRLADESDQPPQQGPLKGSPGRVHPESFLHEEQSITFRDRQL